jgi:parvulin-like peptidyl-prolyl isomerase
MSGTGTDSAEEILAVVGDRRITRAEFERELSERAMRAPGAFLTEANREKILESMIQRELLLAKAEAEGFDQSPEIIRLTEQVIANRYREARLSAVAVKEVEISADEVSAYYLANSNRFRVPAMQRAGVLRLDLDPGLPADKRAEILERARNLHGQALEVSDEQFGELVRQYSDDQSSRYTGGDTGWLTRGQTSIRWPMEIVEAVFELSQPGDLAPLVETQGRQIHSPAGPLQRTSRRIVQAVCRVGSSSGRPQSDLQKDPVA